MLIGEILVKSGVIDADQLDAGLQAQVIHGGRLGTNLIELFELDLDAVANALASQHQLPPALQEQFNRRNPELQPLLTRVQAKHFGAIPLGYIQGENHQRVAVAVMDPLTAEQVEQLAELLGCEPVQCIACELRMHYQLDHVYGVPRPNRFKRARTGQPATDDLDELPEAEREGRQRREFIQTLSDVTPEDARDSDEIDLDIEKPHERSRRHLARIALRRVVRPPVVGERLPSRDPSSFEASMKAIRRATDRDKVADIAIDAFQHSFDDEISAALLFIVRDALAVAWKGFVRYGEPPPFDQIALPLHDASIVSAPYQLRQRYVGPPVPGGTTLDQRLWAALGQGAPAEIAALPIMLFDQVACLVYVQAGDEPFSEQTRGRLELVEKRIAGAFSRLIKAAQR